MRAATIVLICTLALTATAQVPAGFPYDPTVHPNPIVTWVENKDFKSATFAQATELAGVELMTLSQDEGQRESIEIAAPAQGRRRVRIVDVEVEAAFYPVARLTYKLRSGGTFVLSSFRFPRVPVPAGALNEAAFGRPRRPADARFGREVRPDEMEIRGLPGLIFDDGKQRTLYWFELGAGRTVTSDLEKTELLRVLDDLL